MNGRIWMALGLLTALACRGDEAPCPEIRTAPGVSVTAEQVDPNAEEAPANGWRSGREAGAAAPLPGPLLPRSLDREPETLRFCPSEAAPAFPLLPAPEAPFPSFVVAISRSV